jgi:threonine dehydrogenase-like Zn-dependent dehydrogenase
MRALWLENQELRLRDDVSLPSRDGEAVVRVLLAGICNTDIELTRGYYPFTGIPGHEFVGVVDGKRVVGEINAACGECQACRAGRRTHCERRSVLGIVNRNGAFAEFLNLPRENLHAVPDNVSDEEALFTEPLAAALEIQEQVPVTADDRVLVVGHGKLGRLIAQTLALTGCRLTIWDRAAARSGAPATFDIVVECSGNPEAFPIARNAVRPRGTLVMKSTYAGNLTLNMSSIVVDEITIVGSRCGPFAPALRLLAAKKIDVRPLIEATYPLDDALAAFAHAQRPGTLKCIIRP